MFHLAAGLLLGVILVAASETGPRLFPEAGMVIGEPPQSTPPRWPEGRGRPTVPDREAWAFKEEADAVRAATEHMQGLLSAPRAGELDQAPKVALFQPIEDLGPFVTQGRTVWKVEFDRIDLGPALAPDEKPVPAGSLERRVECYYDPYLGDLLRIEITDDASDVVAPPEPHARDYLRQLAQAGPEGWGNPAAKTARISLAEALGVVQREMGGVGSAKKIAVHCVNWRFGPRQKIPDADGGGFVGDSRAAWCIDLRGVPPFERRPSIPVEARNHIRHVVDANTGVWLMASSVPQSGQEPPEAPPPENQEGINKD